MAANSKLFMCVFVMWAFVGISNGDGGNGGGGGGDQLPCMQKLMPCQPYLRSSTPPATCCLPLKEMVSADKACLCSIFNNQAILKSLNLTQDEALQLPKACGANVDISVCKSSANPPSATPSPPATPTPITPGGKNSTKSSASEIVTMGAYASVALIISVFVAAAH
ncbi:hypothetical protein Sjap_024673 [Stephania japonica]|uniref:Bifunctional inhibitor/plant lipid transfer protein/seed storage helical domain-containing protein n=1 Tax=Stephania japonica TaxID=461633 RepID=A0AAP0EDT5_9MAGN